MRLRTMAAGVALVAAMAVPAAAQTPGPLRLNAFMQSNETAVSGKPTAASKPSKVRAKGLAATRKQIRTTARPKPVRLATPTAAPRTPSAQAPHIVADIPGKANLEHAFASSTRLAHETPVRLTSPEEPNELDLLAHTVEMVPADEVNVIDIAAGDIAWSRSDGTSTAAALSQGEPPRSSWFERIASLLAGWFAAVTTYFVG